jgi:hypothetical protein
MGREKFYPASGSSERRHGRWQISVSNDRTQIEVQPLREALAGRKFHERIEVDNGIGINES